MSGPSFITRSVDRPWDIEYSPLIQLLKEIMRITRIAVISFLGIVLVADSLQEAACHHDMV